MYLNSDSESAVEDTQYSVKVYYTNSAFCFDNVFSKISSAIKGEK